MTCLAVAIGLLGFAAMRRAHHRCHGHFGPGCYGPWGMHGGGHGGPWARHRHHRARRWMMHGLLARLDASPAQERAIIAELEKLEDRLHGARRGVVDVRGDLAAALRGGALDDAALGAVLGRTDAAMADARAAVVDALRAIHGLLDDRQRGELADLLDRGGGFGGFRGGPYRV